MQKPSWLNKKIRLGDCRKIKKLSRSFRLLTVCEESLCPNVSECFSCGVATFLILGNRCSKNCPFCGIKKGKADIVDYDEPKRVREAVRILGLNYIVITSPYRSDIADCGAEIFCQTVQNIKEEGNRKVEILIPDFFADYSILKKIAYCGADVISHNLETVPSLYFKYRQGMEYSRSLEVLRYIKYINKKIFTKSGLMLGLGEKREEIMDVLSDLRKIDCDFLTLGQYLSPSRNHQPVKEYISPQDFIVLENEARRLGFKDVKASPYVRSSYLAHTCLQKTR